MTAGGSLFPQVRLGVGGRVLGNTLFRLELELSKGDARMRDVCVGLTGLGAAGRADSSGIDPPFARP